MEEPSFKSYGFNATVEFIEKNYDEAARKRIFGGLSSGAKAFLETAKKAQYAPTTYMAELWTGMVKEHANPDDARKQLVRTGNHMGEFLTNPYVRLLMKMLTMKMFAKKFPDLWARDANFGTVVLGDLADIEKGELKVGLKDLGRFPYFGPITEGWFTYSLSAMGFKDLKVQLLDWSMDKPDPSELAYLFTWTP